MVKLPPLSGRFFILIKPMRYLALLVIVFTVFSCAQKKLVPVGNGVYVDPKTYTSAYENERVKIVVRANAWEGYPSDLEDYVLPLYLEVQNKSSEVLEIDPRDLVILDEKGNQYNALEPKDVAEAVRGGSGVGVSVGFAYGAPTWGLSWLAGGPSYYEDTEDIINRAFIPGRVSPGATLRGFVYFQKIPDEVRRITLRVGYRIGGRREEVAFKFKVRKGSSDNGNKEGRPGDSEDST